jgi:flagellum-specific peptidoglycan hydrolase FlgJ
MTIKFVDAAQFYKAEEQQINAWNYLQENVSSEILEKFAEIYRTKPKGYFDNTWDSVEQLAKEAGAKYPQVVAAQWALESGFGKYKSGKNNFFGIKGKGTVKTTWEDYGYGPVIIKDEFKDFETPFDCINELVSKWYKDYKGYQGVNRAKDPNECAYLLKQEGYATDPIYPQKLIKLMNQYA